MTYFVVGLGNIGQEYDLTRHNIGFMVANQLAYELNSNFFVAKFASIAICKHKEHKLFIIKPSTYMNSSGKAVSYWLNYYKIPINNLLIILDDIHLPFGIIRYRAHGSSAGHNGLKSIEASLNTQIYQRLKLGIGNNFTNGNQSNYVLSKFTMDEQKNLPSIINDACSNILQLF